MSIQEILSSNFTKTKKAFLLFDRGYTRTDVATMITNGNYGFAHNIWKKWNIDREQSQAVLMPFEFSFSRTFGIELEIYGAEKARILAEFRAQGLDITAESYNHNTRSYWKIVTDSSIQGDLPCEIVSPVLKGAEGIEQVKRACIALNRAGAKVNKSCGFHLHLGAQDLTHQNFKDLVMSHIDTEAEFDKIMPESRRGNNNRFCKSNLMGRSKQDLFARIHSTVNTSSLLSIYTDRYVKLNLKSFVRQGTIEFRQHSGTTQFSKIKNWILICCRFVEYVKQNGRTNNINQFLNESLTDYFNDRAVDMAA